MDIKKKRICVITGSRAEYGLLRKLIAQIEKDNTLKLQLLVTGSHLATKYGYTIREIEKDNFPIDAKIKIHEKDVESYPNIVSKGIKGISSEISKLKPDLVLLLGDRYEIFSAAAAAFFLQVPIAHIHGGEVTLGSMDEIIRHAITKMSHFHFVAAEEYKKRVIQLGEYPTTVFNVGGLGVDVIRQTKLISKDKLEKELGINFKKTNFLVTVHPETNKKDLSNKLIKNLIASLASFKDTLAIFTLPNSDLGNKKIREIIVSYVRNHPENSHYFDSLGIQTYSSVINQVDLVIGNSSSGLLEAPFLQVPSLNIGIRQTGRLKAKSVFDSGYETIEIEKKINKILKKSSQNLISYSDNPYGDGGATDKILNILKKIEIPASLEKSFFDL
tara:strand:+ start:1278 stop:2438 length:1161 start_codon:yes stop_codon:yes gene_type:complete